MNYDNAQELFDALSAPFASEEIDWRIGSTTKDKSKGMALAYIDARAVMDRLDAVCGPDGWQCNYSASAGASIVCNLGVLMPDGSWLWKADGAGATDVEGEKGMLSDALKRAAVRWGVGRYLYDLKSPWVALEPAGNSYKLAEGSRKLLDDAHEEGAKRAGWGSPTDVATYKVLVSVVRDTVTQPSDVIAFREKHKGMIPQLRVAARKHLEGMLERIGNTTQQAAE